MCLDPDRHRTHALDDGLLHEDNCQDGAAWRALVESTARLPSAKMADARPQQWGVAPGDQ